VRAAAKERWSVYTQGLPEQQNSED
jgi:hypothetical protein